MRRYSLRDDQWDRIKDILPGREGHVSLSPPRITGCSSRRYFTVIAPTYRGATCRNVLAINQDYAYAILRWAKSGAWKEDLRNTGGRCGQRIRDDRQHHRTRAHQHSAGAQKDGEDQGDRAQQRRIEHQNPRHGRRPWKSAGLLPDFRGKPMICKVPMSFYPRCRPTPCWRTRLSTPTSASSSLCLPQDKVRHSGPRVIERFNASTTRNLYKARHLMENFYCKLKQYRAIATRYDKTARNFLGAIHLAAAVIWLN